MKDDQANFVEFVEKQYILNEEEIALLNVQSIYIIKDYIEIVLDKTMELISNTIKTDVDLDVLMFEVGSIISVVRDLVTRDEFRIFGNNILTKLLLVEKEAVKYEFFETAANFHNFSDIYTELILKKIQLT